MNPTPGSQIRSPPATLRVEPMTRRTVSPKERSTLLYSSWIAGYRILLPVHNKNKRCADQRNEADVSVLLSCRIRRLRIRAFATFQDNKRQAPAGSTTSRMSTV